MYQVIWRIYHGDFIFELFQMHVLDAKAGNLWRRSSDGLLTGGFYVLPYINILPQDRLDQRDPPS